MSDGAVLHVRSPVLKAFLEAVRQTVEREPDRAQVIRALRPSFARLLADSSWLPEEFRQPDPSGGMGEGVGNYLIYRSAARDLSLMSLVLGPGVSTPVHDHLAWGIVGLYAGRQEEWVYRRTDANGEGGPVDLTVVEHNRLSPGDFYDLLPPEGDIHQVRTTSAEPSASIHLLGNDIGCVWRHRYEPEEHRVQPFRSGYSNEPCPEPLQSGPTG